MYLNVTGLETEFIGHDKYCIKWTAHRAATNYRVMVAPVDCESPPPCADGRPRGRSRSTSMLCSRRLIRSPHRGSQRDGSVVLFLVCVRGACERAELGEECEGSVLCV